MLNVSLALAGAVLLLAYAVALGAPSAGLFHDDGIYLVTAKSLAEGRGYRIISLPDAPPQTKYPILFPWLLSLVWRLAPPFPDSLPWLRMVPFASAIAWFWFSWRLIRALGGSRGMATSVVLLTAVAPWTLFLSTTLLSETLFAALVTAALWALTASTTSSRHALRLSALAGALVGAATLTRAAGVAAIAAAVLWLMSRRRWKDATVFATFVGVVAGPWAVWVVTQNSLVRETYYSASPYLSWNIVFSYSWLEKLDVVVRNLLSLAVSPFTLWGGGISPWALGFGLCVVVPLVTAGLWRGRRTVVAWYVSACFVLCVLWVWPPARFLAPVLPLVLWQTLDALQAVAPRAPLVMGLILGGLGGHATFEVAAVAKSLGTVWPSPAYADDWRKLAPLLAWIGHATPAGAVITGNLDPAYYLFTSRTAVRAFEVDAYSLYYAPRGHGRPPLGTVDEVRRRILDARVDYCVWTPAAGFGESPPFRLLLDELRARFPSSLRVVAGEEATGYVVYAIDRSQLGEMVP